MTPLHLATTDPQVLAVLLQAGVDPGLLDICGARPLDRCVLGDQQGTRCAQLLTLVDKPEHYATLLVNAVQNGGFLPM